MEKSTTKPLPNLLLKNERERRGWSRNYVAEKIGSDIQTVARWERGTTFPTPCLRQELCELFGMSAEELGLLRGRVPAVTQQLPEEAVVIEQPVPFTPPPRSYESQQSDTMHVVEIQHSSTVETPTFALARSTPERRGHQALQPVVWVCSAMIVGILLGLISTSTFNHISSDVSLTRYSFPPGVISHAPSALSQDSVAFIGSTEYARLIPDQQFTVSFFAKNTGTTTWSTQGGYALVCEENCLGTATGDFGDKYVLPHHQLSFAFYLTTPSTVGRYDVVWRLEHNHVPFGSPMRISVIVRILPGGWWIAPENGATVSDSIDLIARAYPARVGYPAIDFVNFTIGVGPLWKVACTIRPPSSGDIFKCHANLVQLGIPAGSIRVSFDVYDRMGNSIAAPNGVHTLTYTP
jgi:transcriptional regulator with XRE-family HTH domain